MGKIFETQFEKGSYIERFSGLTATLTNSPSLSKRNKGLCLSLDGVDQFIHYGNLAAGNRDVSAFSIEVSFLSKAKTPYPIQRLMGKDTNSTGWRVYLSDITGHLRLALGEGGLSHKSFSGAYSLIDGLDHHIIITIDRSGNAVAYDNGSIYGITSISAEVADNLDNADDLEVGATVGGFPLNGFIHKAVIYDHLLTTQERTQAYNRFLQAQPLAIEKYPRYNPHSKSTDLSNEVGLIAAYNMIPQNGTLVDISGNGANLITPSGSDVASVVDGMKYKNASSYVIGSAIGDQVVQDQDFTICLRIKPFDVTTQQQIIASGDGSDRFVIGLQSGTIRCSFFGGDEESESVIANQWYNCVFTGTDGVLVCYLNGIRMTGNTANSSHFSSDTFAIGKSLGASLPFDGIVENVKIHNYVFTEQQAKDYHNGFAERINLIEDFSLDPVGMVRPHMWIPGGGAYEIKEWTLPDLGDQLAGWDFTSLWLTYAGGSVTDADTYTCSASGGIRKNSLITEGHFYKYRIAGNTTSTNFYVTGYSGAGVMVPAQTGTFDVSGYFYAVDAGMLLRNDSAGVTNITILEVEEVEPLPGFKSGTKYLECTSAGLTAISNKNAYPTIEFDMYHGGGSNNPVFYFISKEINHTTSYEFNTNVGGGFRLQIRPAGTVLFGESFVADQREKAWYRIKITRTKDGEFYLYAKGGAFGNEFTLLTAGSGTNPVTNNTNTICGYFVIDLDVGDRIANIVISDGVKQ
jgi:hypothetical protein